MPAGAAVGIVGSTADAVIPIAYPLHYTATTRVAMTGANNAGTIDLASEQVDGIMLCDGRGLHPARRSIVTTQPMLEGFDVVKRRSRAPGSSPEVTLQAAGSLGLNGPAVEVLGRPQRVLLLVRADPPALLIQPSGEHPDAYTVQDNGRGAVINAVTAIKALGVEHGVARRYPAQTVGDNGLLVDFSGDGLVVSPRRGLQ